MVTNELVLPCGHAPMHEKCLHKWRIDNQAEDCLICVRKKIIVYYMTLNNSNKYLQ